MQKFVSIFKMFLAIIFIVAVQSCIKKQVKTASDVSEKKEPAIEISQSSKTISSDELVSEFGGREKTEADVRKKVAASLKTVYFDFDKYELKNEATQTLSQNAKIIMENNLSIIVEGHCDERGTQQYNLSLGQKRANTVKDYYIRLGVDPSKIATISYGEEMPVCYDKNEDCWALNRRAETKVTQ